MATSGATARSVTDYDWSSTRLGSPDAWPLPLRVAADLLFNSPLPALLAWGREPVVVFNEAYGALAGPGYGRAPGGNVPPVMPPPLAVAREAMERALRGEPAVQPRAALVFVRAGGRAEETRDLYLTPLRDAGGGIGGVLCTLAPASSQPAEQESVGALRVLVVEDNLDSQYLVCEMLRAFGYEAEGVGHPNDALARLAAGHYDVLFSDVSLPGMSGVELAREALAGQPGIQVIFASGYGDTLLRHLDFPYLSLQKPYEIDQLQGALAQVERVRRTPR
ncbi:response regulator [Massilia agilis]|uniref:Response regulator n=1 Tax=Massilia agilis TaxID=1811226 RepID=A0ABT2D9L1_9BURK|nr:response regulator [Massilia agilis]MCS0807969.1 response regulator [Massilia agilis]